MLNSSDGNECGVMAKVADFGISDMKQVSLYPKQLSDSGIIIAAALFLALPY